MSRIKYNVLWLVCGAFMCACVEADFLGVETVPKHMAAYREVMTDNGKSFIEYQCTAEMDDFNRLSWYHLKGPKHMLMNMTQQQNIGRTNGSVTLHLTLEDSYNNSEVYCLKENRTKLVTYYTEIVRWIDLSFNIIMEQLEKPSVSIKPSHKAVYFDTEETMRFVCKGTAPTDGRKLTWYFEDYEYSEQYNDMDITPHIELAESQKYDEAKHENVLELNLKKSHNLKRLFCAQDLHTKVIQNNGSNGTVRFAQRARSKTITFILRDGVETMNSVADTEEKSDKENEKNQETVVANSTGGAPMWSTGLISGLALILFVALVIVVLKFKNRVAEFEERERLWARAPLQIPDENQYESVYSHGAGLLRRPKK